MNRIKVSLDREEFWNKPKNEEISRISDRIAKSIKELAPTVSDINEFALSVGCDGHTFCPATFKDNKRNKENFEQQQLFALDFDNKDPGNTVSFEDVKKRAEEYDLPILFAYDTFSSENHGKFRVVFLNDTPIPERKVAESMQLALGEIFPEADQSCFKDVARMYFGGKERLYYDRTIPTFNIESLFRNLTICYQDNDPDHYKRRLKGFSKKSGISLNSEGLLDVTITEDHIRTLGASKSGEISPNAIIYNIIANGENSPNRSYKIIYSNDTSSSYVSTAKEAVRTKDNINHRSYRSSVIPEISCKCRLYREFESGSRDLTHDQRFAILTNLIQVETGVETFCKILKKYPEFYDVEREEKWKRDAAYIRRQEYSPSCCDGFCPYKDECEHGKNILSTAHLKMGSMERASGYHEQFYSLREAEEDTYNAIDRAYHADGNGVYVIKAMTSIGKSTSYLRLISENPECRFLVAAPTNLLKNELYERAKAEKINVRRTPSLDEIMDEIPYSISEHIQKLYDRGRHKEVHPYIREVIEKENVSCLKDYMKERSKIINFKGTVITTHRYLLNMSEKDLRKYDAVIIDEDILFKCVLPNQGEITVSKLKKILNKTTDVQLSKKIEKLLKSSEEHTCIETDSFKWDDKNNEAYNFDLPSFCLADKFYFRKASDDPNLEKDTFAYIKPVSFKNIKYIIVSATADEIVYRNYFGNTRIDFYECKKAEYMGVLNQYPGKSMSRTCLANNPGIIRRLMNRFSIDEERVITFMKENLGPLHFGNTEGSNSLKGKDIIVVGTPFHAEFLYKLAAFTMGLEFDEDEKAEMQVVSHNGYRFQFTTFADEDLRHIQFWMIESELEQAVGRARLLRNSCVVHLFSNFPLSQARMIEDFNYDEE